MYGFRLKTVSDDDLVSDKGLLVDRLIRFDGLMAKSLFLGLVFVVVVLFFKDSKPVNFRGYILVYVMLSVTFK